MARIRTIKPEFFTSSDIVLLSPLARLLYIALWCESDRDGKLNWNLKTFKLRYLPADDCDIEELANELISANLVIIYEIESKIYAEIPSFQHHQVINNRESESILPSRVKVACQRVKAEGRKEGREGREAASKDTHISENFFISDNVKKWAEEKGHKNLNLHLEHFIMTCKAKGYKYKNWDMAFMKAVTGNWAKISKEVSEIPSWKRGMI